MPVFRVMTTIAETTLTLHSVRHNMVIIICCIYYTYVTLVTGNIMIIVTLNCKQVAVATVFKL